MIVSKYSYPNLKRLQTPAGRQYLGEDNTPVPSVTTILSETGDKTALMEWRKRVGDAEATRISTESAGLGTKVHSALEKYIKGEEWNNFGTNHVSQLAKSMATVMIENCFSSIDQVYGVEVGLIAEGLYAGTSDAIGVVDGEESIIDFKTAKKLKKREWIEDYFLQGCAYAIAHNEMFNSNIKQVVILMVDRDSNYARYIIKDNEFEHYCKLWFERLDAYFKK